MSPHLCEILIAILSVHPSVTFRCSKKQQTHRKADGAKRPQSGSKRPGGEMSRWRNVRGRNVQWRGEMSTGRKIKGAKRNVTKFTSHNYNIFKNPTIWSHRASDYHAFLWRIKYTEVAWGAVFLAAVKHCSMSVIILGNIYITCCKQTLCLAQKTLKFSNSRLHPAIQIHHNCI